ncbi:MAG: M56 family metallopeptidase [Luteolibacter sp.]
MIPVLLFSIIASGLVFLAGRCDAARDPRLTVLLLALLVVFPMMAMMLPKIGILPAAAGVTGEAGFQWGKVLLGIWSVGFLMAIGRLLLASRGLQRWRKRAVEVSRVDDVAICELENLRGPVAAGIFNRVVFVPVSWNTWTEESREVVLRHELAHHRRRDPLWRLLAELACAVHWYHPLVHWMARRFIMQCEYACDAMVLCEGIDAKVYARVLCDFAEERSFSPLALPMAESSSLESRVRRLLVPAGGFNGKSLLALGGIGLIAACSLSMIGRQSVSNAPVPAADVQLRLTADPFPGEH